MKIWEIPRYIEQLEFDEDKTDLRLHLDEMYYWSEDSEENYVEMEKKIHDFEIRRNEYTIYTWCDISGWKYWSKNGDNYIQISVAFTKEDFNEDYLELLRVDLNKTIEKFEVYSKY